MRKLMAWLMILLLALPCALADEALLLVDRINQPEENADFAFAQDAQLMEIVFPQILDTDAALLRCGGQTMLVDCASAKQAQRVINMLEQMGVTELDCLVNTHPHYDHIQGLELVAKAVKVKEFRVCHGEKETEHMMEALKVCEELGIPVTYYEDGTQWTLGDAVIDVWLKGDPAWSLNNRSAVMRIQLGERTALFTADIQSQTQNYLPEVIPAELLDVDILKYPHHGKHALQVPFYEATSPIFSVITNNGKQTKSKYFLNLRKSPFAFTVPGYVTLTTDGQTWVTERIAMDKPVS